MIRKSAPDRNSPTIRRKVDQLYSCVRYCEDEFRCRRTMQLEFFGERFDKIKCKGTCDNCQAGRISDRRDMTTEALTIINLYNNVSKQSRKSLGVTVVQLTELYRGSKSQSTTRNFNTNGLVGYGAGSKYKKGDVERIMHAMIFERLLIESSVENNGGYMSDYVSLGENATSLQHGSRKFFVEFPQQSATKSTENPARDSAPPKKLGTSKSSKKKQASTKKSAAGKQDIAAPDEGGLQFAEMTREGDTDDHDDDDDSLLEISDANVFKSEESTAISSQNHTTKLINLIKKLTQLWAQEEQTMGNNVHCKFVPPCRVYKWDRDGEIGILNVFVFDFRFFQIGIF